MSVVVKLLGGLCNQLFQYAYGEALTARGYHVRFNKDSLTEGTHREYSLGFLGDLPFGDVEGPRISESSMRYNEQYLKPTDPSTMFGYFQTEKYMAGIENQVRDKINNALWPQKTTLVGDAFASAYSEIYRSISIAVHVRRQDYVGLQTFHGMPSIDYYLSAVKQIQSQILPSRVFVFSDDREWCRQNLPSEWRVVEGTHKYDDLRLISACKHAVLANSSFSWWGAFLGDNQQGRIVAAPEKWFTDPNVDGSDIVPDRWIKLAN